jgi:hypothetical protein
MLARVIKTFNTIEPSPIRGSMNLGSPANIVKKANTVKKAIKSTRLGCFEKEDSFR